MRERDKRQTSAESPDSERSRRLAQTQPETLGTSACTSADSFGETLQGLTYTSSDALAMTSAGAEISERLASSARTSIFPIEDWDKYEFLSILGRGGMGAVYKARDRKLDRIVALKFIRGDDPILVRRFLQEAQAQARLDHPNLCRVYDVGQVEGKPYIAMQFVDGHSLDGLPGPLSLHEKVEVIRDAALALHEAHRQGIIHRDIKPSRVTSVENCDLVSAFHR